MTAVPVVDVTSLNVKLLAPLLEISMAPPVLEETLLKVTPVPDVSVLQLMPLPVVVVILFVPLTLTTPPPVAVNAGFAPVFKVIPPVKLIVEPVLDVSEIPAPVSDIAPLKVTVPTVLPDTLTEFPAVPVIVPP